MLSWRMGVYLSRLECQLKIRSSVNNCGKYGKIEEIKLCFLHCLDAQVWPVGFQDAKVIDNSIYC